MAPVIVQDVSVRAMVYATLEADTTLLALLPNAASSILPRRNMDPAKTATPFLFIRMDGDAGGGDDMDRLVIAIEIHDRPGFGFRSIDAIADRLKWIFNHKTWPVPTGSTERPRRSRYAGSTGELADDGWTTFKRIWRMEIIKS